MNMKKDFYLLLLLTCIFLFSSEKLLSQEKMNEHKLGNISYYTISKIEKDSLIKEFNGLIKKELGDVKYDSCVYLLNDRRVIFDMFEMQTFLFKSLFDLRDFKRLVLQIAESSVERKIIVNDSNFLNKIDLYVSFFEEEFEIVFDFNDLNDLKKLDVIISEKRGEVLKFKLSIIAIIGKYISSNMDETEWAYLREGNNLINPIVNSEDRLFEPLYISEEILYNKKSAYKYLSDLLKSSKY